MVKSVMPIDVFFVFVELQSFRDSSLVESSVDNFLILRREKLNTTTKHEIFVAPKLGYQRPHENLILVGEHLFLEIGEATSKPYWLCVVVELTLPIFGALARIDKLQIVDVFRRSGVCLLMQAGRRQRAICMDADWIGAGIDVLVFFGIVVSFGQSYCFFC